MVELQGGDGTPGAPDLIEVRSPGGPRIEEAGIARRPDDGDLQLRQVAHDGCQHRGVDLERDAVIVHVVPRPLPIRTRVEGAVSHRELDALGKEALMDVERLLDDVAERGLMPLPAKWTERQIRVDTFHRTVVERAVRPGSDPTERDALGGEHLLDPAPLRFRSLANACRLCLQLAAHLARETGNRTETEASRGIALIRADGPLPVAPEERVLRLRARSVGPALGMTAEACEGIGSPSQTSRSEERRVGK